MAQTTDQNKTRAEIANEEGFDGTFRGMIAWLQRAIPYGVSVDENAVDESGRPVVHVTTFPFGESDKEHLVGRLRRSMWMSIHWKKTDGSIDHYEFRRDIADSNDERVWLRPYDGVFETVYRARTLRVETADGTTSEFAFAGGVELAFLEPDRYASEPTGVLTARPATPFEEQPEYEIRSAPKED